MKRYLMCFLPVIFLGIMNLKAQMSSGDFVTAKNFTPATPEMKLFQRYGDIPVSLSSGIPEISIPLFEVRSQQLSVPITLSYHSSGIKVEDMSSPVGLGWVLNAGGSVSRTVVGKCDELPGGGFLFMNNFYTMEKFNKNPFYIENADKLNTLSNMADGTWDIQSDEYYINVPGVSCRFLYDTNKIIQSDAVDRKLIIDRDISHDNFTITDDNGTRFFLNRKEYTLNVSEGHTNPTAWMLEKILSYDGKDSIVFKYINATQYSDSYVSHQILIKDEKIITPIPADFICQNQLNDYLFTNYSTYVYDRLLLDSILFPLGWVKFHYSNDREDPIDERITSIEFCSIEDRVSSVSFVQSYFLSGSPASGRYNKRLRLDQVHFNDNQLNIINSYSFGYNSEVDLPPYRTTDQNNGGKTIDYDYWGYFNNNGASFKNLKTLIPEGLENEIMNYITSNSFIYPQYQPHLDMYHMWASDREPNAYFGAACILKKIIYPTGGYTLFDYEGNRSNESGNSKQVGGVRIKTISSFESNGSMLSQKQYQYGNGDGAGINISPLLPHTFFYWRKYGFRYPLQNFWCYSGNDLIITSSSVAAINFFNGSPVFYNKVTEWNGTASDNMGRVEYTFDFETDKEFAYDVPKYGGFRTNRNWIRGQLLNKRTYNNQNVLLSELVNTYSIKGRKTIFAGLICEVVGSSNEPLPVWFYFLENNVGTTVDLREYFSLIHIEYDFGVKLLVRSEEYDYSQGAIVKITDFSYGSPNHLYLSGKTITRSDNSSIIERYRYPQDKADIVGLSSGGAEALNNLISKNVLSPVIEKSIYSGTTLLERSLREYKIFAGGLSKPGFEKRQIGEGELQNEVTYEYDRFGNIVELYKEYDKKTTIIWGFNHQLPVAQIDNASLPEVRTAFGGSIPELGKGGLPESYLNILYNSSSLSNAMISTFDYKPLIGLKSQTDPNRIKTIYEYDNFGRLKLIKDNDGRILRTFDYQYKN